MRQLLRRAWHLIRQRRLESDLSEEMAFHRALKEQELEQRGVEPRAARFAARRALGSVALAQDSSRDVWLPRWLQGLGQDLRVAVRSLRSTPTVTAVAVLSLALGIGANTAIFSLVNSLLLRTLPVQEPERLALVGGGPNATVWSNPIWEEIRGRSDIFDGAFAWSLRRFDLAQGGEAQLVDGLWASGSFFDVLGVRPIVGRTFGTADDRRGGGPDGPVAVIGYGFWLRQFGGAADAIGREITVDRVAFTIIGVMPPGFFGPEVGRTFDVIIPIGTEPLVHGKDSWLDQRMDWWLNIMVRLRPNQTIDDAQAALRGVQNQIREATLPTEGRPQSNDAYLRDGLTLASAATGRSSLRNRYQRPLLTILVVVGLVLLIACANIANLLLARATARRHELSLRLALGAPAWRLARQLLTESLVLAGVGAVIGLLFARWGSQLIVAQLSTQTNFVVLDLVPDWRVLAFTTAVTVLTALLFGTVPAFRASRVAPMDALKARGALNQAAQGPGSSPRWFSLPSASLSGSLIVTQVALSLILVVAAGLFVRTFASLATLRLGFESDRVLLVNVSAPQARFGDTDLRPVYERVRTAVAGVPGVADVAMSRMAPVAGGSWQLPVKVEGAPEPSAPLRSTYMNAITPQWLDAMGTPLLLGRNFASGDRIGAPAVAIVNQAFVRQFGLGADVIGRVVVVEREGPVQVVGLAADAVYRSLRDPVPATLYVPLAQRARMDSSINLNVRAAAGSPALLTKSVGAAIAEVNRDLVLTFRPLADQVAASLVQERLLATLAGFFGALALLLAGLGLYGVTSYGVNRRRTELGIRMALGAAPGGVVRLVLSRTFVVVAAGVVIGGAVSLWASRYVATLLYDLEPRDPATLVGAAVVLAAVGGLAAWLPAWRASRIDPAVVLRNE